MSSPDLLALLSYEEIQKRLRHIFPEGTPHRGYCTRDTAASTVFAMLYVGAIVGADRYLAPKHVYLMTDRQAARVSVEARLRYARAALSAGFRAPGKRWYADTSREPIRDETLRVGLIGAGAAMNRPDLPTTSPAPRYALTKEFAKLFDPTLKGEALATAIRDWQERTLSPAARARIRMIAAGVAASAEGVLVTFPNRETHRMAAGLSSLIAKAVIEEFAPRFLERAGVLWLSESGKKVIATQDELARELGLRIEQDRNLPDVILVDLGQQEPLFVFVEIVATDGAINPARQAALRKIITDAGYRPEQAVFLTAYQDRSSTGFRRTVTELAWQSFAWFASEPDKVAIFRDDSSNPQKLRALLP